MCVEQQSNHHADTRDQGFSYVCSDQTTQWGMGKKRAIMLGGTTWAGLKMSEMLECSHKPFCRAQNFMKITKALTKQSEGN